MNTSKKEICKILMDRDGMDSMDASDLIDDTQEEINELLDSGCEGMLGVSMVEEIIQTNLGLEPDYLMAFI